jgi:hypothetical protein
MPTAFALASAHSHLAVVPEPYITTLQLVAALLSFELLQVMNEPKPSRRPRDRDLAQPTDFAERTVAFQRRNAVYVLFLSRM